MVRSKTNVYVCNVLLQCQDKSASRPFKDNFNNCLKMNFRLYKEQQRHITLLREYFIATLSLQAFRLNFMNA